MIIWRLFWDITSAGDQTSECSDGDYEADCHRPRSVRDTIGGDLSVHERDGGKRKAGYQESSCVAGVVVCTGYEHDITDGNERHREDDVNVAFVGTVGYIRDDKS